MAFNLFAHKRDRAIRHIRQLPGCADLTYEDLEHLSPEEINDICRKLNINIKIAQVGTGTTFLGKGDWQPLASNNFSNNMPYADNSNVGWFGGNNRNENTLQQAENNTNQDNSMNYPGQRTRFDQKREEVKSKGKKYIVKIPHLVGQLPKVEGKQWTKGVDGLIIDVETFDEAKKLQQKLKPFGAMIAEQ